MKKIIRKFWGVGLIVILLSTLFVGGTVPAASGATLAWGAAGILPNVAVVNPFQIAPATDASIVKVAANGDVFVVDTIAATNVIYKSVNGGRTWTPAVGIVLGDAVTALALSPAYATDGYVYAVVNNATGVHVYQSTTGGAIFGALGTVVTAAAGVIGTSIALDPTFSAGVGGIAVGLADTAAGVAAFGPLPLVPSGVYAWVGAPTYSWAPVGTLLEDVTAVAYSPNFPIDQAILAVGSTALGTSLHVKVFTNAWDAPSYYPPTVRIATIDDMDAAHVSGIDILASSMVLPSDFNASNAATRYVYFGTSSSGAGDDAFRVYLVPGSVITTSVPMGFAASVNNLAYSGTTAAGVLYAGAFATPTFMYTVAPTAVPVVGWIPGGVVTGGAAGSAYVAAAGAKVYVGTTGLESALNISTDGGAHFVQNGFIDTVFGAIQDFQTASATQWFMVTTSGANNSLWKTTDGGMTWVRIYLALTATFNAGVRLSPAFATDKTMYVFEKGVAATPLLVMSSDAGATWTQHWFSTASSGVGINDLVVVDAYTMYAGGCAPDIAGALVYKTSNNGFWWTAQVLTGATGIYQLKYNVASADLVAGTINGRVYYSTDGILWTNSGLGGTGNVHVAFDTNYASNSMFYAGDDGVAGLAGTWRYNVSTPAVPWSCISTAILATFSRDILVTPDNVLYAVDANPATLSTCGGVVRILTPTIGAVPFPPTGEYVSVDDGLVALTALSTLAYAAGSNILYSVNAAGTAIFTYTDTLSTAIPAIVSPLNGAVVLAGGATVIINPVTGASPVGGYQLEWNTRSDYLGAGVVNIPFTPFPTNGFDLNAGATAVPAGSTIYYRVRIIAPVFGPWSQQYNLQTQLAVAPLPNAPPINPAQPAANGGINVPIKPVFTWGAITGATGYEFQLAKDAAMTNLVVDATGAAALGVDTSYAYAGELKYSTTYYWKVKGISGTSFTQWSNVQSFTTAAMPEVAPPPVIIPPQVTPTVIVPTPTVTVNMPTPTVTEVNKQINPSYIWAIIIIGAVLVLAVIVLIVRTRRPV